MKRFLNIFALTQPEQRIIIILLLLLLTAAWFKQHRDLQNTVFPTPAAPVAPPAPTIP